MRSRIPGIELAAALGAALVLAAVVATAVAANRLLEGGDPWRNQPAPWGISDGGLAGGPPHRSRVILIPAPPPPQWPPSRTIQPPRIVAPQLPGWQQHQPEGRPLGAPLVQPAATGPGQHRRSARAAGHRHAAPLSCAEARARLIHGGYRHVRAFDCRGSRYGFHARRGRHDYEITVDADGGGSIRSARRHR
jgi:hypothetical protein